MTVTQQAELSEKDRGYLAEYMKYAETVEATMDEYRNLIAVIVEKSSYRAVARATGLSTNTLQRWVREARK